MSTKPALSNQQVEQNLRAAEARITSGRLKQTDTNAWVLVTYVTSKGLEPTEDAFVQAIVENARTLEWDRLPNFLKLQKESERPATIQSANAALKPFLDATKAGEVKAAKAKADAENLRKARAAVSAFLPVDKRGHVLYSKQGEVQKLLGEYLDREFARPNINTADVLAKATAYITDQYAANERASEHV